MVCDPGVAADDPEAAVAKTLAFKKCNRTAPTVAAIAVANTMSWPRIKCGVAPIFHLIQK